MLGPRVLAASLSVGHRRGTRDPRPWQYHSRSDHHSKVASWLVLADLLATSTVLARHAREGKAVFGVNHEMRDFEHDRKKDLDLVIARPDAPIDPKARTLVDLANTYLVQLDEPDRAAVSALPTMREGTVGAVFVAVEAKAAMTAHVKALPRLFDELNSSQLTTHGASAQALAVGIVMINAAETFVSPDKNKQLGLRPNVSQHRQPADTLRVVDKIKQLPRRSDRHGRGFDALAIVVVDCRNDGSPVLLVERPPAPQVDDQYRYATMITRLATEYDTTFQGI
jgi:hypothetical protein